MPSSVTLEAKMTKIVYCCSIALLTGCMIINARTARTGHLIVSLTDRETGEPITNATVTVRTQTKFSLGGHGSPDSFYTNTSSCSDSNGIAHIEFQFYDSDFEWWVDSPSHYSGWYGFGYGSEHFGRVVEKSDYLNIDTNTVQGLAMYNELVQLDVANDYLGFAAKFEPKSVTYTNNVISRSVCLTPKRNPQSMYGYGPRTDVYLPVKNPTLSVTNGIEVSRYKPIDFDMKECLIVSSKPDYDKFVDGPTGRISDFHIERFSVMTNGVKTFYGKLEFAPGCGAYITNKPGDGCFPVVYEADTNAAFLSSIPFSYSYTNGCLVHVERILAENECMVLRTRSVTNETGVITNCNYSKITGPMSVFRTVRFHNMIFNPNPNDPNLEFDVSNNLSRRGDKGCEP